MQTSRKVDQCTVRAFSEVKPACWDGLGYIGGQDGVVEKKQSFFELRSCVHKVRQHHYRNH